VSVDREPVERPSWLLDEFASAGRENVDPSNVARYDAKEDGGAAAEVALLKELGLGRESVLVEIGSGTGQFAIAVAPACARVIAVDVSAYSWLLEPMILRSGFTIEEAVYSPDGLFAKYVLRAV
jgi:hypothetical protein